MSLTNKINLIFFLVTLLLNLMIRINPPVWVGYGDPYDYLSQSKESLNSVKLYCPEKISYSPRPFTVPLLYKIADSDPDRIIVLQRFIHSIATFFLCYVMLLYFRGTVPKILFIVFWYLLMAWWNIVGWTSTVLSESISISFSFIWIASFLWLFKNRSVFVLILHLLATLLFSFTRDNWPYFLVTCYLISTVVFFRMERTFFYRLLGLFLFSIILFFVQQKTAEIGQRYKLPVFNNVLFRVIPNSDYVKWFEKEGMPQANLLKEKYAAFKDWKDIYPLYQDSALNDFSKWVVDKGKRTYMKFLITHPENILLLKEKKENLKKIFAYNIGYTGEINGYSKHAEPFFPMFNLVVLLVLDLAAIFLYIKEKRKAYLIPSLLIVLFAVNALLTYLADTLETERHLFITNIAMQFIGILLVTLILDSGTIKNPLKAFIQKASGRIPAGLNRSGRTTPEKSA